MKTFFGRLIGIALACCGSAAMAQQPLSSPDEKSLTAPQRTTKSPEELFAAQKAANAEAVGVAPSRIPQAGVGVTLGSDDKRAGILKTDAQGMANLGILPAGRNVVFIDGGSLIAAMDKLPETTAVNKDAAPSLNFGGASAAPDPDRGAAPPHENGPVSPPDAGGGINLTIPLGVAAAPSTAPARIATLFVRVATANSANGRNVVSYTSETPYRRESLGQGLSIEFIVPADDASSKTSRIIFIGGTSQR